jgi:hypothetical protein
MSATMYDTIAPDQPFMIAAYPGAQPIILFPGAATQISLVIQQHTENLREWHEYTNINNALKKQLTDAIEPVYLHSQHDRHIGFTNRSL